MQVQVRVADGLRLQGHDPGQRGGHRDALRPAADDRLHQQAGRLTAAVLPSHRAIMTIKMWPPVSRILYFSFHH